MHTISKFMYVCYDRPNLIETLESLRLRWTERYAGMEEDQTALRVATSRPGKR